MESPHGDIGRYVPEILHLYTAVRRGDPAATGAGTRAREQASTQHKAWHKSVSVPRIKWRQPIHSSLLIHPTDIRKLRKTRKAQTRGKNTKAKGTKD